MVFSNDHRKWPRTDLTPPRLGILFYCDRPTDHQSHERNLHDTIFVDLFDKTQGGACLRSCLNIESDSIVHLQVYSSDSLSWDFFPAKIIWKKRARDQFGNYLVGLSFLKYDQVIKPLTFTSVTGRKKPLAADYTFFRKVKLLKLISRDAVCPILNAIFHKTLKTGEHLIHQGETGDAFYVIQKGNCSVYVEKDGKLHRLVQRSEYDVIGEMAIITGEPRSAHIVAETEMEVWGLSIEDFNRISNQHTELRSFMTEIVAERFATTNLTAERKISKYLITDIIGRGGYSIVYRGIHTILNMPVAIKMLNHDMAMDWEFLKSFKREARTIAQFNHENIIRVFDIVENFKTIFIIMELIQGEPLSHMIQRISAIPAYRAVDFLSQICSGLNYAHQHKIIHRDIKPDNIIVQPDGRLKILDFGLACPIGADNQLLESTLFYMSPEQIEGETLDQCTDLYALGIMAFEMVTGKRPYPEDNLVALQSLHLEQDIPDPGGMVKHLPENLRKFIITCCQRKRSQRYQCISQAIEDLKPLGKTLTPVQKEFLSGKKRMATFSIIYEDKHQLQLNQNLKDFKDQVEKLGAILKAGEIEDI